MMINCLCGTVDQGKALSVISADTTDRGSYYH